MVPMAEEIEAKIRITEPRPVEQALEAAGAEPGGAWIETDTFFDRPDERLFRKDSALRLRRAQPVDDVARASGESSLLTYKGARVEGRLKIREEHQVNVPDPSGMQLILESLGYEQRFCYQKRRRKWRLSGAEITIDEIPHVGQFVEVEAPSEAAVEELIDRLGLSRSEMTTKSYLSMVLEATGGRTGKRTILFDDDSGAASMG
jgi:adenylate cyclase, class 2